MFLGVTYYKRLTFYRHVENTSKIEDYPNENVLMALRRADWGWSNPSMGTVHVSGHSCRAARQSMHPQHGAPACLKQVHRSWKLHREKQYGLTGVTKSTPRAALLAEAGLSSFHERMEVAAWPSARCRDLSLDEDDHRRVEAERETDTHETGWISRGSSEVSPVTQP